MSYTSPSSSASAASKSKSRVPDEEPDEQWKERLRGQIEEGLSSMVIEAKDLLEDSLKRDPADKDRLNREFQATMENIRKIASETFAEHVERERQERRWAMGREMPPEWKENIEKEQQAIMDQIKSSGKSSESNSAQMFQNDDSSSSPHHVPGAKSALAHAPQTSQSIRTHEDLSSEEGSEGGDTDAEALLRPPMRRQPIPVHQRRDDSTGDRSAWDTGSTGRSVDRYIRPNLDRNTPPKSVPEFWTPPPIESHSSNRPQRRGSTASVRSTGSTGFRAPPVADTIPETPGYDDSAKIEQERARIQEADQQWRNVDTVREKERVNGRVSDSAQGYNGIPDQGQAATMFPSSSPAMSSLSTSPSQTRHRPPTPPLNTKPVYRKASFAQDTSVWGIDKRPTPPAANPSHLSLSRPPDMGSYIVDSGRNMSPNNNSYSPQTSNAFAIAQAAESNASYSTSFPVRDPDSDPRARRNYTEDTPYTPSPSSAFPISSGHHYSPTFPLPAFPTMPYPVSSQPPAPFPSSSPSTYIDDEYGRYANQPQRTRSGSDSPQSQRSPASSHEAWRSWNQRTDSLRSHTSNNDLREQATYRSPYPNVRARNSYEGRHADEDFELSEYDSDTEVSGAIFTDRDMLERNRAEETRRRLRAVRKERRAEEEARRIEEERKKKADEDAKRKAEEAKRRAEEEEKIRLEEEAKKKAEEARKKAEEARRKAEKQKRAQERREAEARKREEETRKKEEELRRREEEAKKKEDEMRRREAEAKEAELKQLAEDAQKKAEEARLKEEEARRREEQARIREEEIRQREEYLRQMEEELKRRENEVVQRDKRRREEAEKKEEQTRQAEADRKRMEEEESRRESEAAWRDIRRSEEAKKKEEQTRQAAADRKRMEEEKRQDEKKRQEAEAKRKEEEKRQEEFRKREEEIRRKRQDSLESSPAWAHWSSASSAATWANQSQRQTANAQSPSGDYNTPHRSSSNGWSTSAKSSSAAASTTSSSTSRTSNTSTPASTPKAWTAPGAEATSAPKSQIPLTEEEWQRRNEEQFRQQQEKFRLEQERLEREKMTRSTKVKSKEEIIKMFEHHAWVWDKLSEYQELRWDSFPWPMLNKPSSPEEITVAAISAYILSPHYPEKDKSRSDKDRIKEHIRRWHPDRFNPKLLTKVVETEKEKVREGAGSVVRSLNDLLTKSNIPRMFV